MMSPLELARAEISVLEVPVVAKMVTHQTTTSRLVRIQRIGGWVVCACKVSGKHGTRISPIRLLILVPPNLHPQLASNESRLDPIRPVLLTMDTATDNRARSEFGSAVGTT